MRGRSSLRSNTDEPDGAVGIGCHMQRFLSASCLTTGREFNHNQRRGGVGRVDVLQNRNPKMDQQKKRRRLLISVYVLFGMALLNLVFMFWAFFDGEKLNKGLLAIPCILVAMAVGNLSRLKRLQEGPTPPDPK